MKFGTRQHKQTNAVAITVFAVLMAADLIVCFRFIPDWPLMALIAGAPRIEATHNYLFLLTRGLLYLFWFSFRMNHLGGLSSGSPGPHSSRLRNYPPEI